MRTLLGFLLGAAAVALSTTGRGRKLVSDFADEAEKIAREKLRELSTQQIKEGEDIHDDGRSAENKS